MSEETPIPPVLTVIAASTIEPNVVGEGAADRNSWMVIETAEQGQLLLNLPGPLYRAMEQAPFLAADEAGPGRLALTGREIAAYRERIAGLTEKQ
ncbi:hypothetical protein GCM10011583_07620 [Streptomyces camponoticapitis]|uniref:Uncharacterized protein n=1 Tax=Streptomyces camponoticapitis TaxID=1616125 RepID=A0ABQ2DY77_9ACTN|nr:hypothetical protein [Streptomyces camponoticapitis]GGJ78532.1 hypothetical protein GCM10011583_07620 [Streptomyces camponoticapitis]